MRPPLKDFLTIYQGRHTVRTRTAQPRTGAEPGTYWGGTRYVLGRYPVRTGAVPGTYWGGIRYVVGRHPVRTGAVPGTYVLWSTYHITSHNKYANCKGWRWRYLISQFTTPSMRVWGSQDFFTVCSYKGLRGFLWEVTTCYVSLQGWPIEHAACVLGLLFGVATLWLNFYSA